MPWTMPPTHEAVHAAIDRAAVADLVQTERAARDQGQWARMAACYWPDSVVAISWITSSGPEFVAASERAFAAGVRHLHQMGPSLVTLNGDRALAETGCLIFLPGMVGEVEVTVTCHGRLHARAERRDGSWKIAALTASYFGDSVAVRDGGAAPAFDAARLAGYREPYRHMAYLLAEAGKTARDDLPGPDRPDLLEALWGGEQAWLAAG